MPRGTKTPSGISSQMLSPAKTALSQGVNSSISSSTTLAITAGATILRIYAVDKDILLKWGSTAVTTSNFDEVVPANQICDFVIPVETLPDVLYTTCRVIERSATATMIYTQK